MFAEFIFPHLSPEAVLQMYEHFKKSCPNLDLPTFLDTYHVESNIVWSLEEECIFYPFLGRDTAHSLFSKKTRNPIIFNGVLFPNARSDDILALLPSKKIIPFQFRTYRSRYGLMFAKNPDEYDFFIALLKIDGEFSVVAHGAAHAVNISQNLHLIWEAYNGKYENCSLNFTRSFTIPYSRYIRCSQVCYANLLKRCSSVNRIFSKVVLYLFLYNTAFLPFTLLSFFIDFLTNSHSFLLNGYLPFLFFTIITWRFVINFGNSCLPTPPLYENFCAPEHLDIFAIKPQKLMWRFPILMQRENIPDTCEKLVSLFVFFIFHNIIFLWPFIIYFLTLFFSENIHGEGENHINSCPSWVTNGGKDDCQFYQDEFWWSCTKYKPTAKIVEWYC
jgi:hypothetical protein